MVEFGLIGRNLIHSFSPAYFKDKFETNGIEGKYNLYPLNNIDEITELVKKEENLLGFNVTIPYKSDILPFLSNFSDDVKSIGAVNVIKIKRTKSDSLENRCELIGYNTDWIGFKRSIKPWLNDNIKSALILGTGGASKAVSFALDSMGIKAIFVSRNPIEQDILHYDDLDKKIIQENLLIINTTPLGMFPNLEEFPDLPYHHLTSDHICYDLIYNPVETMFLRKSSLYGAKVKNGLEMLHFQADEAFKIWMDMNSDKK